MILEDVFGSTRNPNAALRKELAERCGMRERSVQIWFQNRRARSRPPGLRRKNNPQQLLFLNSTSTAATHSPTTPTSAISMATPTSAIPTPSSTTSLLFPPPISTLSSHHHTISSFPSSTPTSAYLPSPSASILPLSATSSMGLLTPYSSHPLNPLPVHTTLPTHMTTPSTPIHHLPITSLSCGTWRRTLDPNRRDLLAGANLSSRCLQFVIDCNNTGFRVEIPFDSILHINSIPSPSADELHLSIDLAYPPNFCMQVDAPQSKIWIRCSDFTEGGQGSSILFIGSADPEMPFSTLWRARSKGIIIYLSSRMGFWRVPWLLLHQKGYP
ncbi:hypothetical protein BC829DRAFT_31281 [Chytridium lagenaria]|nr:hypothetical protein BC829DRAFT_31281 [Chytridium lagenaria]